MTETAAKDTRPPINQDWLDRMRREKPDFLARLFQVFLEDEPDRLAKLSAAVTQRDLEQTRYLAHSIKGAAAVLGMERLSEAAKNLEHAAKDCQDGELDPCVDCVRAELEAVFGVIRNIQGGCLQQA